MSQNRGREQALLYGVLLAVVLAGCVLFTRALGRYGDAQARADIATVAATAAAALSPQRVAALQGNAQDAGSPELHELRDILRSIQKVNPDARFVYLMRHQGGHFVFLADAEPETSKDYSPPGQVYDEQIAGLQQVLGSATPVVEDPYRDSWGEWVSALAPVMDPHSHRPVAVLGMDISASRWSQSVARYRAFAVAICALFAGVVALFLAGLRRQRLFSQSQQRLNSELKAELAVRRRAERDLRLSAAVLANTGEGVVVMDARGIIQSVNPAFEHISGYRAAEVAGKGVQTLYEKENKEGVYQGVLDALAGAGSWQGEIWSRRKNGERYPQEVSVNVLRDDSGKPLHFAAIMRDNTAQRQLEDRLNEMASMDGLTAIPNRRQFDETLRREWTRAQREKQPLSLVMADLDFFKRYNDRYGHLAGDECLRRVASALRNGVKRPADLAARYGGEEFALVLPATDEAGAQHVAGQVNAAIHDLRIAHEDSGVSRVVTISAGHATLIPLAGMAMHELIKRADNALYQAKHGGRNCVRAAPAEPEPPPVP